MIAIVKFFLVTVSLIVLLVGCKTAADRIDSACTKFWDEIKYGEKPFHNVLVGGDDSRQYRCYSSWSHSNVDEAVRSALKNCSKDFGDNCYIYAKNGQLETWAEKYAKPDWVAKNRTRQSERLAAFNRSNSVASANRQNTIKVTPNQNTSSAIVSQNSNANRAAAAVAFEMPKISSFIDISQAPEIDDDYDDSDDDEYRRQLDRDAVDEERRANVAIAGALSQAFGNVAQSMGQYQSARRMNRSISDGTATESQIQSHVRSINNNVMGVANNRSKQVSVSRGSSGLYDDQSAHLNQRCSSQCYQLKNQCGSVGGQAACYKAAACTCQCFYNNDPRPSSAINYAPSRQSMLHCVRDNNQKAAELQSRSPVLLPTTAGRTPSQPVSQPSPQSSVKPCTGGPNECHGSAK